METPDRDNLPEFFTAWSQGELAPAQAWEVRELLQEKPESFAEIDRSFRLAAEARRTILASPTPASASLRNRIESLPLQPDESRSTVAPRPNPFRIQLRRTWALAATVFLAVGVGIWAGRSMPHREIVPSVASPNVIPIGIVNRVEGVHAMCARVADRLHAAGYPTDAGSLPADVTRDTHSDRPYPDLSSLDFRYIGAGPCGDTLPGTVHLLYKSTRPGSVLAISLFVQANHGQYPIDANRTYRMGDSPFPMYVWRTEKVVYFLVADNDAVAKQVMAVSTSAPR